MSRKPGHTCRCPGMRFRGGQLLITTGAPYGEGTNSQQNNTQNTPLTLDNPHIHTPGMISCSPAPLAMPIRLACTERYSCAVLLY